MIQTYDDFFCTLMQVSPELWRESGNMEFKAAQGRDGRGEVPDSMWETYSSMANTNGGYVLLGVKELKEGGVEVLGIADVDRVIKNLWNQVNDANKVSINHARIMDLTDAHPADVSTALQNLVNDGFLVATGIRRGKTYSPAESLSSVTTDKQQGTEDKNEDKNEDKVDKYSKITEVIENSPKLTIPQLADKMQMKVSRMRSLIVRLEKERGLRHIGSRKAGHWEFTQ